MFDKIRAHFLATICHFCTFALVWEPVFFNFGFIFVSSMGSVKLKPSSHIYRWILYWLFALIFGVSSQYGNLSYRAVSANYPLYSSYSEENVMSNHAKYDHLISHQTPTHHQPDPTTNTPTQPPTHNYNNLIKSLKHLGERC